MIRNLITRTHAAPLVTTDATILQITPICAGPAPCSHDKTHEQAGQKKGRQIPCLGKIGLEGMAVFTVNNTAMTSNMALTRNKRTWHTPQLYIKTCRIEIRPIDIVTERRRMKALRRNHDTIAKGKGSLLGKGTFWRAGVYTSQSGLHCLARRLHSPKFRMHAHIPPA